jgi:hypothetical protein
MRLSRLETWPNWCYMPVAAMNVAVSGITDFERIKRLSVEDREQLALDAAYGATFCSWRATKGVYVFDTELLAALFTTPLDGEIPGDLLRRLPEWGLYLSLRNAPGSDAFDDFGLDGVFVTLNYRKASGGMELRLLFAGDDEEWLVGVTVQLGGTLEEGIRGKLMEPGLLSEPLTGVSEESTVVQDLASIARPVVNLLLYVVSDAPDIDGRPVRPQPVKTKRGMREFPAPAPRTWNVGARMGAALRSAMELREREDAEQGDSGGRGRPRPHFRRAHWALRWTGPRTEPQTAVIRWIGPTLVAATASQDELPAVIHRS